MRTLSPSTSTYAFEGGRKSMVDNTRYQSSNRIWKRISVHSRDIDRDFHAIAASAPRISSAIGMSERASPAPKSGSPRLNDAHSAALEPGGWRVKTITSSNVMRLTDVCPVKVAALHGGVIGTSGENRPWISSGKMY